MSIQKTGLILSAQGHTDRTIELNGRQSQITADSLYNNTTYTVTAYVKDEYGNMTRSTSTTFRTLEGGIISLSNKSTYNGTVCTVLFDFTSTYDIDTVKIFNDKTKDFENPITYTPTVSGTTSGTIRYRANEPFEWFKLYVSDIYGEVNEEEIFNINDLPTP